ncbi:geranyl transferase [Lysobacteraceae bacterium NML91-0213]|nr:geranyl transferase [Xanthomonadaceae bacterium NML91-0213]
MSEPAPAVSGRFDAWRQRADAAIGGALDTLAGSEPRLLASMRHATLLGGKRMRPLLVYATGTAFGVAEDALDPAAAAVELIHAYSLVHDDLPSMDDDALRRGQPTVHVAFDEGTAVLCGDALQSLAFALLADAPQPAAARVAMLRELATAAGAGGMCGGQARDLAATGTGALDIAALERLHAMKTGALLRAAVRLGALAADVDPATAARLDTFADALGLAFQIRDDLLDVESDSSTLGKTAGKDVAQDKATFPALIGIEASRQRLQSLAATMDDALAPFDERATALATLGRHAITRSY